MKMPILLSLGYSVVVGGLAALFLLVLFAAPPARGDQGEGGSCCFLPLGVDAGQVVGSSVEIPPSDRVTTYDGVTATVLPSAAFEVPVWTLVTVEITFSAVVMGNGANNGQGYFARGRLFYTNVGGAPKLVAGPENVYVIDETGLFEGADPGPGPSGFVVDGNSIIPQVIGLPGQPVDWMARVDVTVARLQ